MTQKSIMGAFYDVVSSPEFIAKWSPDDRDVLMMEEAMLSFVEHLSPLAKDLEILRRKTEDILETFGGLL